MFKEEITDVNPEMHFSFVANATGQAGLEIYETLRTQNLEIHGIKYKPGYPLVNWDKYSHPEFGIIENI